MDNRTCRNATAALLFLTGGAFSNLFGVTYLDAGAPAGGDGASWQSAFQTVGDAVHTASTGDKIIYAREGVYKVTDTIPVVEGLRIYGGFAGTESTFSEADPAAHPTIFTGDQNGDDFWQPKGKTPAESERIPIFADGVFRMPNPEGTDDYWLPRGNNSENTPVLFADNGNSVTNLLFDGLTFLSFKTSVLDVTGTAFGEIRRCRFLANGDGSSMAVSVKDGAFEIEQCEFIGNERAISFWTPNAELLSVIRNCSFVENYAKDVSACVSLKNKSSVLIEDSRFYRNCASSPYGAGRMNSAAVTLEASTPTTIRRCLFKENRVRDYSFGTIVHHSYPADLTIDCCQFIGNDLKPGGWVQTPAACVRNSNGLMEIRNTYFSGNRATLGEKNKTHCAATLVLSNHRNVIINCTFSGNILESTSTAGGIAGTVLAEIATGFVNCVFDETRISGQGYDIFSRGKGAMTLALVNTIVRNTQVEDYSAFYLVDTNCPPCLADVAISGIDMTKFVTTSETYFIGVSDEPGGLSAIRYGENGAMARGITMVSPYRENGRPVYEGTDGIWYVYEDVYIPQKPWRRLCQKDYAHVNFPGHTKDTPLPPDAFGQPRALGKIAYGPLNALPSGTIMLLR